METVQGGTNNNCATLNPTGLTTWRKDDNQGSIRVKELSLCAGHDLEVEHSDRGPGMEYSDQGLEMERNVGPGMEQNDQGPGMEHSDQGPGMEHSDQGPGMEHSDQGPGMEHSDHGPEVLGMEDIAKQGVVAEGQWWHVNKGGFPIPEETWEKMWQHVTDTHPSGAGIEESIRERPCRRVSRIMTSAGTTTSESQLVARLSGSIPGCSQRECTLWPAQCAGEPDGRADVPAATAISFSQ